MADEFTPKALSGDDGDIEGSFRCGLDAELDEKLQLVTELAVKEYVEWLIAAKRFSTISELDTDRFLHLYLEVRKEVPTVDSLVDIDDETGSSLP